jgi:hypothetical protein
MPVNTAALAARESPVNTAAGPRPRGPPRRKAQKPEYIVPAPGCPTHCPTAPQHEMKRGIRRSGMRAPDGNSPEPQPESGGGTSSDEESGGRSRRGSTSSASGSDSGGSESGAQPADDDEDKDFSIVEQYVPGVGTLPLPGIQSKQQKAAAGGRRNDKPLECFAQLPTAAEVTVRYDPPYAACRVDRRAIAPTPWRTVMFVCM